MANCKKCGAYIPIGETACPACGYDPEAEAREAKERAEAEAKAKKEQEEKAKREAQEKSWAQQEREREEAQRRRWSQDPRQSQTYGGGAAQSQYTSQRTGQSASQGQYTSQRTGDARPAWAPPWQEQHAHGSTGKDYHTYAQNRARAEDSADHQGMSVLSYIGPLFLIPLLTRPDDDFARYHANQGLVLFLASGAVSVLLSSGLGSMISLAGMVLGIRNVLRGKKEPLPFIGKFQLLKKK